MLDIKKKKFFTVRVVRYWNREIVDALSLVSVEGQVA